MQTAGYNIIGQSEIREFFKQVEEFNDNAKHAIPCGGGDVIPQHDVQPTLIASEAA
jgi:hypothetical protein